MCCFCLSLQKIVVASRVPLVFEVSAHSYKVAAPAMHQRCRCRTSNPQSALRLPFHLCLRGRRKIFQCLGSRSYPSVLCRDRLVQNSVLGPTATALCGCENVHFGKFYRVAYRGRSVAIARREEIVSDTILARNDCVYMLRPWLLGIYSKTLSQPPAGLQREEPISSTVTGI